MCNAAKRGMLLFLIVCMLASCCGCFRAEEQPVETKPIITIPEPPSTQYVPEETHPLSADYKKQPNAYVAFSQSHQQPYEVYVPVEEVMAYTTQYPDCTGSWYRDQLQGEDLLVYNCYLYAQEHCYHWISVYVEDNDRDFGFIREAVSMDSPFIEQNLTHYERTFDQATNYWGEQLWISMDQFAIKRWEMRMEALEKCRQIVSAIPAEYETQLQKMEYLYRYVCDHVEYVEYETMKDEDYLYDAVIKGQTVCDGYSNMLMLLFRLIGVECCEAAGYDVDLSLDEEYEDAGGHTWVVAKVDGNWYNFDATYEDTKGGDWNSDTVFFGFSDLLVEKKFLNCDSLRPKCSDLSRDFPYADLTVSGITEGAQVKQIVRLVEKRLKAGETKTTIGLHGIPTEKQYDTFFDKYSRYVTMGHYVELSYMNMGSSSLLFLTAKTE